MRIVSIAALLAVLAAGAACGGDDPQPAQPLAGAVEVTVEPARLTLLRDVVTANGQITPHPDADWTVHAAETAMVAELPIAEGEPVKAGDIVVKFEVPSRTSAIEAAEFDLALWTARLDRATTRVGELTRLFQSGLTARVELDTAKSELATAETTVAALTATLATLRAAEARDVVRARFPGLLLKRWHYQGDLVTSGGNDPVVRIVDPARRQVTLDVTVADAVRLMPGQPVLLTAVGAAPMNGSVASVVMAATADATMTRVIVNLPASVASAAPVAAGAPAAAAAPEPGPAIGDPVLGEIVIAEVPEAMVVPTRAILRTTGSPYVLAAGADGRVVRRELRLGVATQDLTQVLEGIQLGEFVITSALTEISEGDLVRHRQ